MKTSGYSMVTPEIEQYLQQALIPLRLACKTRSGWPMVLSLWYVYDSGRFYCATRPTAKVVSYLQTDRRCAFEIAADEPPYCGVRGQGIVTLDQGLGSQILERLAIRYLGSIDKPLARQLLARADREVALVIEPVKLFHWNYSDRMKDSVEGVRQKPCP